jgi:anthranilate phosphoribosyltransferase
MAEALSNLGAEHALVVHGMDGLDEISTTGPTRVFEIKEGAVREFTWTPGEFGVPPARLDDLLGGDAERCAALMRAVLSGEPGPLRDIVLVNAAAAIYVAADSPDMGLALERATESLDSGAALSKLEALTNLSNELATEAEEV